MRRALGWLFGVLFLLDGLAGIDVRAQEPLEQPQPTTEVRDILVRGNERIETLTVESYLTLRRGNPFDSDAIDQSLRNLFATGLFDDVAIGQVGDTLVIEVVENPIINRIAFEGNRRIDDETLEAEVQLRPRIVFTRARVQAAVARILELYRRNGRFAASVEPKIIELDQNRVDLVFEIEEGPLTRVSGITFIGNESFSENTLRDVIETRERAWYRFFSSADTYDPDRLAFDEELLRRFYLERGYVEFVVLSSLAELTPEGDRFFITFTLEEGPQYRLGSVDLETSIRDLEVEQFRDLVTVEPGEIYNAEQIEEVVQALTERAGQLGYAFANVEPVNEINRDDLLVDLVFRIDEGPRVYVERIDIIGNVRTLDRVIRREFRLAEGDPYNLALLRRSEQRVRNLGYFETVEVRTERGSTPDRVIIVTEVAERSTGELSFGAGFSSADGPLGDIRLEERNLLGRGYDVTASFTISGRRQDAILSFTDPWFLGRELAAGFDIFRTRTDFQSESSFDETSTGGTLRANYPLTERLRHGLRYTLREDEIDNVDNSASVFIQDEEGSQITSLVGQTFTYDRRDTRFLPSEGYLLRLDQDVAGLGGDSKFLRHEVRGEYYFTIIPDVVLSFDASGGYIKGLGDDVNLSNRFFVGGTNLRGFQVAGIGPRDTDTDDALGGNLYYTGTAELRFPLGLPDELRLFGRAFVDAGNLYDIDVSGPTLDDESYIRVSAGVGISWLSPLGPLALDFAQAVRKDDRDETETFRISFGTRF
jgi:outer membrane protein insertion porin family